MPKGRIRAILFDFGETLFNFGPVDTGSLFRKSARISYEWLQKKGQPVGRFSAYCMRNLMAIRLRYLISNIIAKDFDTLALLRKLGTKRGIVLDDNGWEELAWLWYLPLSEQGGPEPQLAATLERLKGMDLKLGILSNTFVTASSLDRHLRQLGVLHLLPMRLYSYEFRCRKPDARIFQEAAARIGEQPENILFVGDRTEKDICPALKLGMHAALKKAYTNAGKKTPDGAHRIDTLAELPALIEKIERESPGG